MLVCLLLRLRERRACVSNNGVRNARVATVGRTAAPKLVVPALHQQPPSSSSSSCHSPSPFTSSPRRFLFLVLRLFSSSLLPLPPSLVCETGRPTIDDTRPNRSASHMGICATRTRRANDFPLALAAAAAVRARGDFFFLWPVGPFAVNGRECFAR